MHPVSLDEIDRKILMHLQLHARATNVELSEHAHLSPPQCYRRMKRLEEEGFIQGAVAILDREKMGYGVMAFVSITRDKEQYKGMRELEAVLNRFPEVLECYSLTGDYDYLLKVVAQDLKEFSTFLREKLMRAPGVLSVRSFICLEEIKCSTALPIEGQDSRQK
jgi:Lrp/AsnC family transcriptional regulator, leucine-responsive regulatory protein